MVILGQIMVREGIRVGPEGLEPPQELEIVMTTTKLIFNILDLAFYREVHLIKI